MAFRRSGGYGGGGGRAALPQTAVAAAAAAAAGGGSVSESVQTPLRASERPLSGLGASHGRPLRVT